ncbi:hypothetical protein PC116_g236 [Phytophthora cactorum]|nr:hypothetical protein PC122_g217 [Phytophthora cactorum]KAG4252148.1 hypothetical protein PC116_g236 [Phytophthora cactorum]
MAGSVPLTPAARVRTGPGPNRATTEATWVKWLLIGLASLVLIWLLILPLVIVLMEAL